jgi:hypothetical protein
MSFARRSLLASLTFVAVTAFAAVQLPAPAQAKKDLVLGTSATPTARGNSSP